MINGKFLNHELVGLNYQGSDHEPYIDLYLRLYSDVVVLRFWSPQQVKLDEGFPYPQGGGGIEIYDIGDRNLEGLSFSVGGHESKVSFYARAMEVLEGYTAFK